MVGSALRADLLEERVRMTEYGLLSEGDTRLRRAPTRGNMGRDA